MEGDLRPLCHWIRSCWYPCSLLLSSVFILISDLNVAQVTFLQTLLASGTKDFSENQSFLCRDIVANATGCAQVGTCNSLHNMVSLENQQLFPTFQSKQNQNTLLKEEYLPMGRFLHKGHPTGSLPSLSKTGMLTQRATAQAVVPLCIPGTGETQHSGMGSRHKCSCDATCISLGTLDPFLLGWSQSGFNFSYPLQFSGYSGVYLFCIFTSLFLSL